MGSGIASIRGRIASAIVTGVLLACLATIAPATAQSGLASPVFRTFTAETVPVPVRFEYDSDRLTPEGVAGPLGTARGLAGHEVAGEGRQHREGARVERGEDAGAEGQHKRGHVAAIAPRMVFVERPGPPSLPEGPGRRRRAP